MRRRPRHPPKDQRAFTHLGRLKGLARRKRETLLGELPDFLVEYGKDRRAAACEAPSQYARAAP